MIVIGFWGAAEGPAEADSSVVDIVRLGGLSVCGNCNTSPNNLLTCYPQSLHDFTSSGILTTLVINTLVNLILPSKTHQSLLTLN
jgi:hypothetical protein